MSGTEGLPPRPETAHGRSLSYLPADRSFALLTDHDARRTVRGTFGELSEQHLRAARNWQPSASAPWTLDLGEEVEGYGTFRFPYGPFSMGVPEAGTFELVTYGERLLEVLPGFGQKPRGILASLPGLRVEDAALRVERMVGPYSTAHVAAFLFAAEAAAGTSLSAEEAQVRALGQELQRVYNHLHVLARLAEAASQNVGQAQTHALAEEVLRLAGRHFGHRWLFGSLLPGGPRRRLDRVQRTELDRSLAQLGSRFEALWELFQGSRTFVDRLQGTGRVGRSQAISWGAVGPVLRACGVPWDDRLRDPLPPYHDLFLPLAHQSEGDALARTVVRVEEVRSSLLLLEQLLDRWPNGGTFDPLPPVSPRRGLVRTEAPSGDLVWDVLTEDGRVRQAAFRSASQANWPLFALACRQSVFTDFHFTLESFGLSFAETDG
jgi:Ni,Fe-hydrogenase III large subunit